MKFEQCGRVKQASGSVTCNNNNLLDWNVFEQDAKFLQAPGLFAAEYVLWP